MSVFTVAFTKASNASAREACRGAPWIRKFGKPLMREIWVVTPAYARLPDCIDFRGGRGESQGNPMGDGEFHLFLAGICVVLLGNRHHFSEMSANDCGF